MAKLTPIIVNVELKYKISLWAAIKLRIAGPNYKMVAEAVIAAIKERGDV